MPTSAQKAFARHISVPLRVTDIRWDDGDAAPSRRFVRQVAARLARNPRNHAPGIVLIPNAKRILRTKQRVLDFQLTLMERVRLHFLATNPAALTTNGLTPLLEGSRAKKRSWDPKRCTTNDIIVMNGLSSYRDLHTDEDSQLYVSLCYYDVRDIRGGSPRFLDLCLLECEEAGKPALWGILRAVPSEEFFGGETPFGKHLLVGRLQPGETWHGNRLAVNVPGLDYGQMPIVIFANRVEGRLMHGATHIRRVGPRPSRKVRHVTIGHRTAR